MEISPEQKQAVASWAQEGLSLAEIQRRLDEEFSLSMTYMDVRFLVDDLELTLLDDKSESSATTTSEESSKGASTPFPQDQTTSVAAEEEPFADSAAELLSDEVSVEVDRLLKPGSPDQRQRPVQ